MLLSEITDDELREFNFTPAESCAIAVLILLLEEDVSTPGNGVWNGTEDCTLADHLP